MPSSLAGYSIQKMACPNFQAGRQLPIDHITVHHCAGFVLPDATFANPARQASSTYAVQGKTIHQYVDEANTPWTDGNWYSNNSGITLELVNASGDPDWRIAEDTFDTAARLCADILYRRKLGKLSYNGSKDGSTLYRHCDLSATGCPGPWFKANTDRFIALTNQYLAAIAAPAAPAASQVIQCYNPNNTKAQRFKLNKQPDGTYEIRATTPNAKCLDVSGGRFAVNTAVQLYSKNDSKAQRWFIEPNPTDGLYLVQTIRPAGAPELALDVIGGGYAPGTKLQLYRDNGSKAQRWVFIPTGAANEYVIASAVSGLVLDAAGGA